jgi:membrane complex biogenesis BtpA family protein
MQGIQQLFARAKPIIGVVHLPPLIGSPRSQMSLSEIRARALSDAARLAENGVDGIIIENYGDSPFLPDHVEAHTVAAMAVLTNAVWAHCPQVPIGVNVLRNDANAALAIAAVTGARFARVNVHTGAMLTDQGLLEGAAHETLRYRSLLRSDVKVFADVAVKHAALLAPIPLAELAADTYYRGLADALIVTGSATGKGVDLNDLRTVKAAVPEAIVLAGSGVTADTLAEVLHYADGVIVGTSVKHDGVTQNEVDPNRVRALIRARG